MDRNLPPKLENSESAIWQRILVGSTAGMYALTTTLTGIMYGFFAGQSCTLNHIQPHPLHRYYRSLRPPAVQEANPRSGMAQVSMVALYCTYLIMSAVGNHTHATCNLLTKYAAACTGTVILGGLFMFVAIAYLTTHAAMQGRALVGKNKRPGIALAGEEDLGASPMVTRHPPKKISLRYQARVATVEAGAIPASTLYGMDDSDDEEDAVMDEERDDERTGTQYNVHLVLP